MKTLLAMGLLLTLSTPAFAAVVKTYDAEQSCDLYKVENVESTKLTGTVVFPKAVYGPTFENLEVNFENREAKVQVTMNIVMGINRPLMKDKLSISADNVNFTSLINQVNRKVFLLEKICISSDNKIVYAKQFETKE